ncbi:MAG: Radical domain protein [Myxococcaceae bacterium]|nr:Radical domain protein [Myxococcaceae bacterium]
MNRAALHTSAAASVAASGTSARIGGVTYLNAWPILYGLMLGREPEHIRMAYPSVLAERLVSRECDIALAPVATLALRSGFELAPRICIGADGKVASVLIVSQRPIEELDTLLLDTQSKTSVVLAQLLTSHLRKGRPLQLSAADHARIERDTHGATGAVVIGDRALAVRDSYAHVLDMGEAWKQWTGLPFVFAAWIAQRGVLDDALLEMLERSLEHGLAARREIAHFWVAQQGGEPAAIESYLTHNIRYRLDDSYRAGLREFFARAQAAKLIDAVDLRFFGG